MPPVTLQEEGLTKGTSRPSHCPMLSGSSRKLGLRVAAAAKFFATILYFAL